jgi:hypothetical protein
MAMILALWLIRRRKRPTGGNATKETDDDSDNNVNCTGGTLQRQQDSEKNFQRGTTNEIWIDPNADEVSTLDGGTLLPLSFGLAPDEPTASVNLDFDFNRNQYRTDTEDHTQSHQTAISNPTAFTGFSKLAIQSESEFADHRSFEEQFAELDDEALLPQPRHWEDPMSSRVKPFEVRAPPGKLGMVVKPFEVRAPPGKLGMVVDTPNGGVPVVRAIKPDSVLSGSVRMGDRLISVDDINVTKMSALEVSNLISVKQNHQRLLVFCRL